MEAAGRWGGCRGRSGGAILPWGDGSRQSVPKAWLSLRRVLGARGTGHREHSSVHHREECRLPVGKGKRT